jgi:hypothetical protein
MIDRDFDRQMVLQSVQMARVVGMQARGMDPSCHGCVVEYEVPKWTGRHTCAMGVELDKKLAEIKAKKSNVHPQSKKKRRP